MQKEIITPEILAEKLGRGKDAIRKRWRKAWPERPFSALAELTESEVQVLSGASSAGTSVSVPSVKDSAALSAKRKTTPSKETPEATPEEKEEIKAVVDSLHFPQADYKVSSPASARVAGRVAGLYFLLTASTAASVYNLLQVTLELADLFSAVTLTVVLSAAAVVFVSVGIQSPLTRFVVVLLIGYEAMCNTVRIYGGLTHWGEGTPNVFLRTVTDVFGSGTFETATFLGAFTALLIAGVQYAAVFEINKIRGNGKI